MAQQFVPDGGLNLVEHPQSKLEGAVSKNNSGLAQVMQLELTPDILGDVLRTARHGGKGVNVQFGKTIVSGFLNSHNNGHMR